MVLDIVNEESERVKDRFQYEYFKALSDRIIYIDTDIDIECGSILPIKQIYRWNLEDMSRPIKDRLPIYILFYSYGGDANICTSMIDAIQSSKTPIIGVNLGVAYSAAAYMFISCHIRFMAKRSSVLFHQGSAEFGGDYSKIMAEMNEYGKKVQKLSDLVTEFTNYPKNDVEEHITEEWYVYADEALKNGVCDFIINNIEDIFNIEDVENIINNKKATSIRNRTKSNKTRKKKVQQQ